MEIILPSLDVRARQLQETQRQISPSKLIFIRQIHILVDHPFFSILL